MPQKMLAFPLKMKATLKTKRTSDILSVLWLRSVILCLILTISPALAAERPSRDEVLQRMQQGRAAALADVGAQARNQQMTTHQLKIGDQQRSYDLFIPGNYSLRPQNQFPLVIVLHGGGGNSEISEHMTRFVSWANGKEFILIHPNGTGRMRNRLLTWNAGNCCAYAHEENIDDVGFIRALIDHVSTELRVDPKRIYVAGMSNGAKMAYRLACQLSDKIAAIAPVAGSMEEPDCSPESPVSVIAFHGTADAHVLYEGGTPEKNMDRFPREDASFKESVGFWVNANQCNPLSETSRRGAVEKESFSNCLGNSEVVAYTIEGGGHAWPGGVKIRAAADDPSPEIHATKEIVNFFLTHPKE